MGSQSVRLTTQTTINANSTITVSATEGWQEIPFFLGNPVQFIITYVPGQKGWTVDKRTFSYVGLAGYSPDEDRQIFQGCKINSSWPYGALLGKIREGGAPFLVDHEGLYTPSQSGSLYLRIHDDDRCLVDNDGFLRIQLSEVPAREPTNLIVLVHRCCTDPNSVNEWFDMRNVIVNNILSQTSEAWQIVVWEWTVDTPPVDATHPLAFKDAYDKATNQGKDLATAILKRFQNGSYKYIHLIGHSAGARLIHTAASEVIANNTIQQLSQQNKPFIHLTFLDAFRPPPVEDYGNLGNYPKYYSEHYVDVNNNSPTVAFTNDYLPHAFNFDITGWTQDKDDRLLPVPEFGHQWPRRWYQRSIITKKPDSTPAFAFGYTLSFEGSNGLYNNLS